MKSPTSSLHTMTVVCLCPLPTVVVCPHSPLAAVHTPPLSVGRSSASLPAVAPLRLWMEVMGRVLGRVVWRLGGEFHGVRCFLFSIGISFSLLFWDVSFFQFLFRFYSGWEVVRRVAQGSHHTRRKTARVRRTAQPAQGGTPNRRQLGL